MFVIALFIILIISSSVCLLLDKYTLWYLSNKIEEQLTFFTKKQEYDIKQVFEERFSIFTKNIYNDIKEVIENKIKSIYENIQNEASLFKYLMLFETCKLLTENQIEEVTKYIHILLLLYLKIRSFFQINNRFVLNQFCIRIIYRIISNLIRLITIIAW